MKIEHVLGAVMVGVVIVSTIVSLCGVWGMIPGETAVQVVVSAVIVGACVYASSEVHKNFFRDKK